MKLVLMGIAGLFGLSACGGEVIVGAGEGGSGGATLPIPSVTAGAGGDWGGGVVAGSGGAAGGYAVPEECSASPESDETYSTAEGLNALLIGRWRRCLDPQIAGEDVGVEFTEEGKVYPLTTDETQQVVRRTGPDYELTWAYTAPGGENPISHQPSATGFLILDDVLTDSPQFTNGPRQLRILFSPVQSKYVPLP